MVDPFKQFADQCGLRMDAEPLCVAPRDVLAPLDAVEQHFLVTLTRAEVASPSVRMIFLTPVTAGGDPSLRDVLWWLAGDSWALEQAEGNLVDWAATYGYPPEAEATAWLFEQSGRQAAALRSLLGDPDMKRLMTLYGAEVAPSRAM